MTPTPYLTPVGAALYLLGCATGPAFYVGGRLLGAVLGRVSTNPVRWL